VIYWSIRGQLIDQLLMAAVVINAPLYKGALTACLPHVAFAAPIQGQPLNDCPYAPGRPPKIGPSSQRSKAGRARFAPHCDLHREGGS
jgi:hypothetical protein